MGTAGLLGGAQRHRTSSSSGRDQEPSGTVRIFLGVGFGPSWPVLVSLGLVTRHDVMTSYVPWSGIVINALIEI